MVSLPRPKLKSKKISILTKRWKTKHQRLFYVTIASLQLDQSFRPVRRGTKKIKKRWENSTHKSKTTCLRFFQQKGGANARHLLKNIYKKLQDLRIIPKIEINEKNDYNIKEVVGELVKRNIFLNFSCQKELREALLRKARLNFKQTQKSD